MRKILLYTLAALTSLLVCSSAVSKEIPTLGVFTKQDPRLEGLTWGNWGSRPYEYYWVQSVVPVKGKRVLDLGIGTPSAHTWYKYVISQLQPSFYSGIDCSLEIKKEEVHGTLYELRYMNMAKLDYPDESFDVAFCISTFEHIPYDVFMKSIEEAYRVLRPDGLLVITLDEHWNKNIKMTHANGWNTLEETTIRLGLFDRDQSSLSFSLPNFVDLIKDYFVLLNDDAVVDVVDQTIYSEQDYRKTYYQRKNADNSILYSPLEYNSSVSYAVLKKAK